MALTKLQKNQLVAICSDIFPETHFVSRSKQSLCNIIACIIHQI